MAMRHITFPTSEWTSIQHRLETQGDVFTTRVSNELGKYKKGDILITPWGETVIVESVKRLNSLESHPFYRELTTKQKQVLSQYTEMDLVKLVVN